MSVAYQHTSGDLLALDRICAGTPPGGSKAQWFADKMQAGETFPPIRIRSWANARYIVVDQRHRFAASVLAKFTHVPVVVEGST